MADLETEGGKGEGSWARRGLLRAAISSLLLLGAVLAVFAIVGGDQTGAGGVARRELLGGEVAIAAKREAGLEASVEKQVLADKEHEELRSKVIAAEKASENVMQEQRSREVARTTLTGASAMQKSEAKAWQQAVVKEEAGEKVVARERQLDEKEEMERRAMLAKEELSERNLQKEREQEDAVHGGSVPTVGAEGEEQTEAAAVEVQRKKDAVFEDAIKDQKVLDEEQMKEREAVLASHSAVVQKMQEDKDRTAEHVDVHTGVHSEAGEEKKAYKEAAKREEHLEQSRKELRAEDDKLRKEHAATLAKMHEQEQAMQRLAEKHAEHAAVKPEGEGEEEAALAKSLATAKHDEVVFHKQVADARQKSAQANEALKDQEMQDKKNAATFERLVKMHEAAARSHIKNEMEHREKRMKYMDNFVKVNEWPQSASGQRVATPIFD